MIHDYITYITMTKTIGCSIDFPRSPQKMYNVPPQLEVGLDPPQQLVRYKHHKP